METGKHCAYNVTRNALLSERVAVAEATLGSLEILGLVMHGPGANQESAVWLTGLLRPPELPRLVALDVLYLDESHRIVASGTVGPGTDFAVLPATAASALILPDQRLAQTGTRPDDQLRFCSQMDLPAVIKAASHSVTEYRERSVLEQSEPRTPAVMRFEVIRPAAYVFEPFVGSLMYIPEVAEPQPVATEYFLPQTAPSTATRIPVAVAASEEAVIDVAPSPHVEAIDEPGTLEEAWPEVQVRRRAKKSSAKEKEPPRFYRPKPVRFFDPTAAAAEPRNVEQTTAQPMKPEPIPPRMPNELSPELKAAILRIDEQQREKQETKRKPLPQRNTAREKPLKGQKQARIDAPIETQQPLDPGNPILPARNAIDPAAAEALAPSHSVEPQVCEALPELIDQSESPVVLELRSTPHVEKASSSPPTDTPPELPLPEIAPEPLPDAYPVSAAIEQQRATPVPELEPSEPLSALAETTPEVELIEASLSTISEATPDSYAIPNTESVEATPPYHPVSQSLRAITEQVREPGPPSQPLNHPIEAILAATSPVTEQSPHPPLTQERPAAAKPQRLQSGKKQQKLSLAARFQRWLDGDPLDGKRRGNRVQVPGLVAFYWSGGAPRPHEIVNISKSGFYLRTREFWIPNTLVRMTLQKSQSDPGEPNQSISILARVVRADDGGVGHEFVTREDLLAVRTPDILPETGTDRKLLEEFLNLK